MKTGTKSRATLVGVLLIAALSGGGMTALAAPSDGYFQIRASSEGGPENGGYESLKGPTAPPDDSGLIAPAGSYDSNLDSVVFQLVCENDELMSATSYSMFGPVLVFTQIGDGEIMENPAADGRETVELLIPAGTPSTLTVYAETPMGVEPVDPRSCTIQGPAVGVVSKSSVPAWGANFSRYENANGG